jgi:hypothetical protein
MNRYAKESAERNKNSQIVEVVDRFEGCIEIFKLLPPESARYELRGRLFTKILSYSIYDYKWEEILEDPEIVNKWAKESAERNKNTQIVEVDNGNGNIGILKLVTQS